MTYELMEITKKIDLLLETYFLKNEKIKSASVALDMSYSDYKDRKDNIYTIIIIGDNLGIKDLINLDEYLNKISKKLETERIKIQTYFSSKNDNYKRIILNAKMYTNEQFEEVITYTLKHQLGLNHRNLYGDDYLKKYQNLELTKEELENDIKTYIESLNTLENKNNILPVLELTNMLFKEIYNYAKRNYTVPDDKMIFFIRLLGKKIYYNDTLFLLHGILTKSDDILIKMFKNPIKEIRNLLNNIANQLKDNFEIQDKENKKLTKININ